MVDEESTARFGRLEEVMNLEKCVEYMSIWFLSDTIELFDSVLYDDETDPQYSAITTCNRLWIYLQYKKSTDKSYNCSDVVSLLRKSGYTADDIALFRKKVQDERPIYTADILDTEFF